MPRARRARDRRSRARRRRRREVDPLPLILQIEVPLRDAMNFVDALRLIGHGLTAHDETGGDAVAALAYEAHDRLETVKAIWNRMLEERRRARRAK
jgi:hypothetical protein